MSDFQAQARALGDPTRHELFRYIAEVGRPVDVSELTEHLGFHHNAIRQHLAKLVDASLVCESSIPSTGRGRPRLSYTLDASAESRWGVTGPYERLTLLLTEVIRSGESPLEVGKRAGGKIRIQTKKNSDPIEGLVEAMATHGFEPQAKRRGSKVDIVFGTCPFETTAMVDPDTVCELHRGLAVGAAESLDGLVIDDLVLRDPRRGTCALTCHVES
jgi:predicted ArsR family transcriptional regulator